MSEVVRDFKRLKVDESDKETASEAKCHHSTRPSNYFTLKSSPYSPKMSYSDKRQTTNGFRRQRLHLPNKTQPKSRANEEIKPTKQTVTNDFSIYKDFSDLRVSCQQNMSQNADKDEAKQRFFNKDFKFESFEWRKNCVKPVERKAKNRNTESRGERQRKLKFNEDKSCARQAMDRSCDASADELAAYLDDTLFLPRKMSFMAEMMYT